MPADSILEVVTYVAFFRNLNQGQRNSPSGAALVEAFVRNGATDVAAFQTNGTVTFHADNPPRCAENAAQILKFESPWSDVVFVQSLHWLSGLASLLASDTAIDPVSSELTLFAETVSVASLIPIAGRRCQVIRGGAGFAITVNERPNESNGTPTIERAIGQPATSRGLPTLLRLVA